MKVKHLLLALLVLVAVVVVVKMTRGGASAPASSGTGQETPGAVSPPAAEPTTAKAAAGVGAMQFKDVRLTPPAPTTVTELSAALQTNPGWQPNTDQTIRYLFWINGKVVQQGPALVLPARSAKKNDWVFCDAALMEGERELYRLRSSMVMIRNSSPVIDGIDFPSVRTAGRYYFSVRAHDEDGDPISLAIEGGNRFLQADGASMRIAVDIGENTPETIAFTVVLKDNDGGESRQAVTYSIQKTQAR